MRFDSLPYFARNSSWRLDKAAMEALEFPMPDDVLKQFILDHGLKDDFQQAYADLDLHRLTWDLVELPTAAILASSSKFETYITDVAVLAERHVDDKPHPPCGTPKTWQHWFDAGTWLQSPIFLEGVLAGEPPLHLVEGHTRVGNLTGLLRTHVKVKDRHACWVGRNAPAHEAIDWVAVLEAHPLSFRRWLLDAEVSGLTSHVASKLLTVEDSLRYTRSFPPTFEGLVELAAQKNSGVSKEQLDELVGEWRRELEEHAGRALNLNP